MLSSLSYVCLGVCAGMWVISRGIYLGVLVLSFISVLPCSQAILRSVWVALGLKRAAPKVCVFSCWDKLRFRGE